METNVSDSMLEEAEEEKEQYQLVKAAELFASNWFNPAPKSGRSHNEKSHAQSYWRELFNVVGITDAYDFGVKFEYRVVSKKTGAPNYIDCFIPGVVVIEHKSGDKKLDDAETQARDYVDSLNKELRPNFIILNNFHTWRVIKLTTNEVLEFTTDSLSEHIEFIRNILTVEAIDMVRIQMEWDRKAATLIGNVHKELIKAQYDKHSADVLISRLLFLMFCDDLKVFYKGKIFTDFLNNTREDGTDLGAMLGLLFQVLNKPRETRMTTLPDFISVFPHIGSELFEEVLHVPTFNKNIRDALVEANNYEWKHTNPIVFGALYESFKNSDEKGSGGEFYTSERNILKVLNPILLSGLEEKKQEAWNDTRKLEQLRKHLGNIKIFDPACGSGNFLSVAYRELRKLEIDIIVRLKTLQGRLGQVGLMNDTEVYVVPENIYGIEIEEQSSQLARVSLYLMEQLMNKELENFTGNFTAKFPIQHVSKIVWGNALQVDWQEVCPVSDNVYIVGNPPFIDFKGMNKEQKADHNRIWGKGNKAGNCDFVSNWFILAGRYMAGTKAHAGFISTNSITQGIQPALLWTELYKYNMNIDWAHRSFKWSNGQKKDAAVSVVAIGFSANSVKPKSLFYYDDPIKDLPVEKFVDNINGYLLPTKNIIIPTRSKPIKFSTPSIRVGSMALDDGWLSKLNESEVEEIAKTDTIASKYLSKLVGSEELISGDNRYCLWLKQANPEDLRKSTTIKNRLLKTKEWRQNSNRPATKKASDTPHLFVEERQPNTSYIAIPVTSSEKRKYVPISFFDKNIIANSSLLIIAEPNMFLFSAILSSLFNVWVNSLAGRLGNSYRFSSTLVYNNFPFPTLTDDQKTLLEASGQAILDARALYPDSSLAALYDPLSMPVELRKAHKSNDKLVLSFYGLKPDASYDEIIDTLFTEYEKQVKELEASEPVKKPRVTRSRKKVEPVEETVALSTPVETSVIEESVDKGLEVEVSEMISEGSPVWVEPASVKPVTASTGLENVSAVVAGGVVSDASVPVLLPVETEVEPSNNSDFTETNVNNTDSSNADSDTSKTETVKPKYVFPF
jgi:hypothetical protein